MTKKARRRETFRFKAGFNFGGLAAETDPLLETCFVTTGCYEAISNVEDKRCVLVGRSGTGKTAVIDELKRRYEGNIIVVDPESLAFQFLGKSEMIRALRLSGINLDYFYKLIWRHILVVEILKFCFPVEARQHGMMSQFIKSIQKSLRPDKEKEIALKYLDKWDASILQPPQDRIKEIHDSLGKKLRAKLGSGRWLELFGVEGSD